MRVLVAPGKTCITETGTSYMARVMRVNSIKGGWRPLICTYRRELIDARDADELREQVEGEYHVCAAACTVVAGWTAQPDETSMHAPGHEREHWQ